MSGYSFIQNIENKLLSVVGQSNPLAGGLRGESLLVHCMNLAGAEQGLHFKEIYPQKKLSLTEMISAIAQDSGAFARKITLPWHWWNSDSGSMLVFSDTGELKVAIRKLNHYELLDPASGATEIVLENTASNLKSTAFIFYPLLPSGKITGKSFLEFALHRRGRELRAFLIVSILISLLNIALPLAFSTLIGNVIPSANRSLLVQLTCGLIIIGLIIFLLTIFRNRVLVRFESKIDLRMQPAYFNRLLMLPAKFFLNFTAGDLAERAMSMSSIRNAISGPFISIAFCGFVLLSNLFLMLFYSLTLTTYALAAIIIYLIVLTLLYRKDIKNGKLHLKKKSALTGRIFQFTNGITKIRSAGKSLFIIRNWSEHYAAERTYNHRSLQITGNISIVNQLFPWLSLLLIYIATVPILSSISPATFIGFVTAFGIVTVQIAIITASFTSLLKASLIFERMRPILEEEGEPEPVVSEQVTLDGKIEFNQVSYRYSADSPLILNDISFKINAGQYVAFVGESGSGKSTIFRILLGFQEPISGSVYFDDLDLKQLNKKTIRRQMGVILQNSTLLNGSIYENLAGQSTAGNDAVWEALTLVGMDKEIAKLPMKLHTILSDAGEGFSGGERQRLLVARALLNKPQLLLFDEATSALDNLSQKIITNALHQINATKIVIAHRLETIMGADHIFFIGNGNILQQGAPSVLLYEPGPFQEFAERQLK